MRKALLAGVAVAVLAAQPAIARPARTVSTTYTGSGGVQGVIAGSTNVNGDRYGYAELVTRRGDRTASVTLADDAGLPVAFRLVQEDPAPHGHVIDLGAFCSSTSAPVRLARPGAPLLVYIEYGACGAAPSFPTSGTVTARLG